MGIHTLPNTNSLIIRSYQKECSVYEISKYYKEDKFYAKLSGHISII